MIRAALARVAAGATAASAISSPAGGHGMPPRLGTHVLALGDGENLSYGLRKEGLDLDFAALRAALAARCDRLQAHAFATVRDSSARDYAERYFVHAGWRHHVELAETVHTFHGTRTRANSDSAVLLACGELFARVRPDTVVLATGDGDLGCDMARFLKSRPAAPIVVVCSLHGATSRRLLAGVNPNVDLNMWIEPGCVVRLQ